MAIFEDIDMDYVRRLARLMSKTSVWIDRDRDYGEVESGSVRTYMDVDGKLRPEAVTYGLVTKYPYNRYPIHIFSHTPEKKEQKIQKMREWADENPAPANMFLITIDEDYSDIIDELSSRGYNIQVAYSRAQGILPALLEFQSRRFL